MEICATGSVLKISGKVEVTVYYDSDRDIFLDVEGRIIDNIFQTITPNDLLLFKNDPGYNIFPCRHEKDRYVYIYEYPDDTCGGEGEEYYDENLVGRFGELCDGDHCWFSCNPGDKAEICYACSGR